MIRDNPASRQEHGYEAGKKTNFRQICENPKYLVIQSIHFSFHIIGKINRLRENAESEVLFFKTEKKSFHFSFISSRNIRKFLIPLPIRSFTHCSLVLIVTNSSPPQAEKNLALPFKPVWT